MSILSYNLLKEVSFVHIIVFYKNVYNINCEVILMIKNIFIIAIPIVIQNFISALLNMLSTIMIGRVGETQIAAVGIANQVFFLFTLILFGICSGFGIFVAQFWGKKDIHNIKKIVGLGATINFLISLLFMLIALMLPRQIMSIFSNDTAVITQGAIYLKTVCLSYIFAGISMNFGFALRCVEQAFLPMVITSFALICDAFLNYTLIFGHFGAPMMGIKGAALATLIARAIEVTLMVSILYYRKSIVAFYICDILSITKEFVSKIYKTVAEVVVNDALWGLGIVIYSAAYGRIGTGAMASIQICSTVQNLFMVIVFGICSACSVMVGNSVGAGDTSKAKDYSRKFLLLGSLTGLALGCILALCNSTIITLFKVSESVSQNSQIILYILAASMLIRVFNMIVVVGIFRGGGDSKSCLIIETFTMWCIGIPLAFIGAIYFRLPVYWVYALVNIEELAKFILSFIRFISYKWIKNLIHNI